MEHEYAHDADDPAIDGTVDVDAIEADLQPESDETDFAEPGAEIIDLAEVSAATAGGPQPELGADNRLFRTDPATLTIWIALREVDPTVWRRIVVPAETRLPKLARILAAAMGWDGRHRHRFTVGDLFFGPADPDQPEQIEERRITLGQVLPKVGSRLSWVYDFGDSWQHDVVVEAMNSIEPGERYPRCDDGENACPPEDCGGPWGYNNLRAALEDSDHADHREVMAWVEDGFDPTEFDTRVVTRRLRQSGRGR